MAAGRRDLALDRWLTNYRKLQTLKNAKGLDVIIHSPPETQSDNKPDSQNVTAQPNANSAPTVPGSVTLQE